MTQKNCGFLVLVFLHCCGYVTEASQEMAFSVWPHHPHEVLGAPQRPQEVITALPQPSHEFSILNIVIHRGVWSENTLEIFGTVSSQGSQEVGPISPQSSHEVACIGCIGLQRPQKVSCKWLTNLHKRIVQYRSSLQFDSWMDDEDMVWIPPSRQNNAMASIPLMVRSWLLDTFAKKANLYYSLMMSYSRTFSLAVLVRLGFLPVSNTFLATSWSACTI